MQRHCKNVTCIGSVRSHRLYTLHPGASKAESRHSASNARDDYKRIASPCVSTRVSRQLVAQSTSVQKALDQSQEIELIFPCTQTIMPASFTVDLKDKMSAASTDVEKQHVNEIPVVPVAAPKTLGAGVSSDNQKTHGFAKVYRQDLRSEPSRPR